MNQLYQKSKEVSKGKVSKFKEEEVSKGKVSKFVSKRMEEVYVIKLKGLPLNESDVRKKPSIYANDLSIEILYGLGLFHLFIGLITLIFGLITITSDEWKITVVGIGSGTIFVSTGFIGIWSSIQRKDHFLSSNTSIRIFFLSSIISFLISFILITSALIGLFEINTDQLISERLKENQLETRRTITDYDGEVIDSNSNYPKLINHNNFNDQDNFNEPNLHNFNWHKNNESIIEVTQVHPHVKINLLISLLVEIILCLISIFTSSRILWPNSFKSIGDTNWPTRPQVRRKIIIKTSIHAGSKTMYQSADFCRALGPNCVVSLSPPKSNISQSPSFGNQSESQFFCNQEHAQSAAFSYQPPSPSFGNHQLEESHNQSSKDDTEEREKEREGEEKREKEGEEEREEEREEEEEEDCMSLASYDVDTEFGHREEIFNEGKSLERKGKKKEEENFMGVEIISFKTNGSLTSSRLHPQPDEDSFKAPVTKSIKGIKGNQKVEESKNCVINNCVSNQESTPIKIPIKKSGNLSSKSSIVNQKRSKIPAPKIPPPPPPPPPPPSSLPPPLDTFLLVSPVTKDSPVIKVEEKRENVIKDTPKEREGHT